ncbi:MAG TPA: hypothetical protein VGF88_19820 [Acidobacteriaceae bacterium]|jgi:hypothetical protein
MKLPFVGAIPGPKIDERFLDHRRRSTSLGGIAGAVLALALFEYHLIREHIYRWELFAVGAIMVIVKLSAMAWYHFTD